MPDKLQLSSDTEEQLSDVPDMLQLVPPSAKVLGPVPLAQPRGWSTSTAGAE